MGAADGDSNEAADQPCSLGTGGGEGLNLAAASEQELFCGIAACKVRHSPCRFACLTSR